MSLLAVHMSIAEEAVERSAVLGLQEHLGAVLLGCTAPDRRVQTREPRQDTHYFRLAEDGLGDGLRGLRQAHPSLLRSEGLDRAGRAFLAGYLSHLATDEAWIVYVYRPFFGDPAYLGADPARNVLDRALQYDQERMVLADRQRMAAWRQLLGEGPPALPEGFIAAETLRAWHAFVCDVVTARDGGWQEFPRFIARFRSDPGLIQEEVEQFLADPEAMFRRVFQRVPRDILADHRERSVQASIQMAREVLA